MTVYELMNRLIVEFPDWSTAQAFDAATKLNEHAEQMSFQLEVERTLNALPMTTEAL